jgi:type VI secretion system secreted protein VgrG
MNAAPRRKFPRRIAGLLVLLAALSLVPRAVYAGLSPVDLRVFTSLGGDVFALTGLKGDEQISQLFRFELELASEIPTIDARSLLGQSMTVSIGAAGETRFLNGVVTRFTAGGPIPGTGLRRYHAELSPWLWFLTLRSDNRIFQGKSVPEVIDQIFGELGFAQFDLRLSRSYEMKECLVQYRETDFNFVSRLMEQEGIAFYFEHSNGDHTLVLADSSAAYPTIPGSSIPFTGPEPDPTRGESVEIWSHQYEFTPGRFTQSDYNFETPSTSLTTTERSLISLPDSGKYEIYDYPGEYATLADGQVLTKLRMEAEEARHDVVSGSSTVRDFSPGSRFTLTSHPGGGENGTYLLTATSHVVETDSAGTPDPSDDVASYDNSFVCIPESVSFRPPRISRTPVISGPQTAVVVGPEGEEIFTDEYGRVKVQFHWDREGQRDENSSCWIRVAQPWAGKKVKGQSFGVLHIPRIGHEVVVEFLEGDPDRPLVTGRVYNAEDVPPRNQWQPAGR